MLKRAVVLIFLIFILLGQVYGQRRKHLSLPKGNARNQVEENLRFVDSISAQGRAYQYRSVLGSYLSGSGFGYGGFGFGIFGGPRYGARGKLGAKDKVIIGAQTGYYSGLAIRGRYKDSLIGAGAGAAIGGAVAYLSHRREANFPYFIYNDTPYPATIYYGRNRIGMVNPYSRGYVAKPGSQYYWAVLQKNVTGGRVALVTAPPLVEAHDSGTGESGWMIQE